MGSATSPLWLAGRGRKQRRKLDMQLMQLQLFQRLVPPSPSCTSKWPACMAWSASSSPAGTGKAAPAGRGRPPATGGSPGWGCAAEGRMSAEGPCCSPRHETGCPGRGGGRDSGRGATSPGRCAGSRRPESTGGRGEQPGSCSEGRRRGDAARLALLPPSRHGWLGRSCRKVDGREAGLRGTLGARAEGAAGPCMRQRQPSV